MRGGDAVMIDGSINSYRRLRPAKHVEDSFPSRLKCGAIVVLLAHVEGIAVCGQSTSLSAMVFGTDALDALSFVVHILRSLRPR